MTPTEIARVAAGLTAEQVEVLLDIPNGESRRAVRFSGSVARNLRRANSKRPALVSATLTCGGRVAWFATTAFGSSVRDHILREKSGG